jgi:hypothetical protein
MAAPLENKNAEIWTLEQAEALFNSAIELSNSKEFDFIGEVAKELGSYHHAFKYLSDKFPSLKYKHNIIISNCESNCFFNGKKSNIVPSLAIMNLKSNHGWTDRNDNTSGGEPIKTTIQVGYGNKNEN